MLVTMFAFVMAGLPTHAEVSECTKTHEGGCANYNKVVLAKFRENDFNISTCLTKCRTNTRCEGFALGKNRVRGKCILYKSDDQGNQCIKDSNKNWDYYSMNDCSAKRPTAEPTAKAKPQPIRDCADAEYQILRLNEEIKRANVKTQMIAQSYENDMTVSREVLEQVEEENAVCQETEFELYLHIDTLEGELKRIRQYNHHLESLANEWEDDATSAMSQYKKLREEADTCKDDIGALSDTLADTKMERDQLASYAEAMQIEMSDLAMQLDDAKGKA